MIARILNKLKWLWVGLWLRLGGPGWWGRFFTRIGTVGIPPYYERHRLARMVNQGYFSPSSHVYGQDIRLGNHLFVDDRVLIYQGWEGGMITIAEGVKLQRDTVIQTGQSGSVQIGAMTDIQLRCHFSGFKGSICIGSGVMIAPNCSFFPYDHETVAGTPIRSQPLVSKGDIVVEDDVWIGTGVVVMAGVTIGRGAVIGAGAVVTNDVPENAIAVGVPAAVKGYRQ